MYKLTVLWQHELISSLDMLSQNYIRRSTLVYKSTEWCLIDFFSSSFRRWTDSCSIFANSMAAISTSHVGGRIPWPSVHLISPSCTAASSLGKFSLTHAFIVDATSPTRSRTALALPAACLLTYVLNSTRWSERSAERTRPFTHSFLTSGGNNLTHQPQTIQAVSVVSVLQALKLHRDD